MIKFLNKKIKKIKQLKKSKKLKKYDKLICDNGLTQMEKEAYEESISYLFQLAKFFPASDDDLNRCRASRKIILKEFLGYFCELNKYDAWTRGDVTIFHVTGTKGKGSVCHFLNSTLSQLEPTVRCLPSQLNC